MDIILQFHHNLKLEIHGPYSEVVSILEAFYCINAPTIPGFVAIDRVTSLHRPVKIGLPENTWAILGCSQYGSAM